MEAPGTKPLFSDDAYLKKCRATVITSGEEGFQLDQTVFYGRGGGQPGDIGFLTLPDGTKIEIADTVRSECGKNLIHVPGSRQVTPAPGTSVTATIEWPRRYQLMRMHSCLHLLSAVIDGMVTGGQVGLATSRLDFDVPITNLDKLEINDALNKLIEADHQIIPRWVSSEELVRNPALVKTMSVKPPEGTDIVRLIDIEGTDLQACGGTHVAHTGEIGQAEITKIKNKGRRNRRVTITLSEREDLP